MKGLNHHHLRSFWAVAREGSITGAANALQVTPSTVSMQVASLEEALDTRLFRRVGNRLEITHQGRIVQRYASDIFALSDDLVEALAAGAGTAPTRFAVGISDSLPLLSAHRVLAPALALPPEDQRIILRVDKAAALLGALMARTLDMVLTDTAGSPTDSVRTESHLVAESDVLLFAAPKLARRLAPGFPGSLDGAPFILHTEHTPLRRGLDGWLARHGLRPRITAEVEDVGLLQLLGEQGRGVFAAPELVSDQIRTRYGVEALGRAHGVVERFYALTLQREPRNPGVRAVLARETS